MKHRFHSLRIRLLLPLLAVSILAALAVAIASYWLGDRWAKQQLVARFDGIARTLSAASFPLNRQVIGSLAELTNTELMTLRADGSVSVSSLDLPSEFEAKDLQPHEDVLSDSMRIGNRRYLLGAFPRDGRFSRDGVDRVAVLFDESELQAARLRAAGLPLITGLSTVFLLTSVTLLLAGRLINRLSRLGQKVDQIAEGKFDTSIPVGVQDEIGLLASAVGRMGNQLRQMWNQLSRSQGEKLLHQIAGGLAHQLRNSLTGARMAIELHARSCDSKDDESIGIAISQLEQTEDHVRRLLLVAAGKQDEDRPANVSQCINDVRGSLDAAARHLHVNLRWYVDKALEDKSVTDGSSLSGAISNLILNAMQAGENVSVTASQLDPQALEVCVEDDGPGPADDVADELFEPFVTSKPEGLGLGLPLVARSAGRLGGTIKWDRKNGKTRFVLIARLSKPSSTEKSS